MDIELLSYLKRSVQRIRILNCFGSIHSPSEISRKCRLSPSHVSRTLKEFCKKGLLECMTPNSHTGRLFQLSKSGEEMQNILKGGELAEEYEKEANAD